MSKDIKPKGVFEIAIIENLEQKGTKNFVFDYNERTFEFQPDTGNEAELWVKSLKILKQIMFNEQETAASSRCNSYFQSLKGNLPTSHGDSFTQDDVAKKKEKVKSKAQSHKFMNVNAKAFLSVLQESPEIIIDKELT
mmetsp:Transcript_12752/g.12630  ORF Transcript_12752/g.12630 Transcript_12752/m.12630 type:complete len:138 (+) Transcript_12752:243-656(+)